MRPSSLRRLANCLLLGSLGLAMQAAQAQAQNETLVLRGDRLYLSPDQPPLVNGAVLIRNGRIVSVGPARDLPKNAPAPHASCSGPVLTAGFTNSHVHLLGPQWSEAATGAREPLEAQLHALLSRHGFSSAVDLGSDRDSSLALQKRITAGELSGPRLLTLGLPIFPPKGLPGYLLGLSPAFLARLPQPETPEAARHVVKENMAAGAVGSKLFVVTPRREGLTAMPAEIARAAADATRDLGGTVVAHPTDIKGVQAAMAAGVNLLAHTTHGNTTPWPPELLAQVAEKRIAMTPTLMLMGYELAKDGAQGPIVNQLIEASVSQVRAFLQAGGEVIFGTDAGYMSDLDPSSEYQLLARAGMKPMEILASLTTRPAARWKDGQRGKLAAGYVADVAVLDADPADDVAHFARVHCTVSAGKIVHPLGAGKAPGS